MQEIESCMYVRRCSTKHNSYKMPRGTCRALSGQRAKSGENTRGLIQATYICSQKHLLCHGWNDVARWVDLQKSHLELCLKFTTSWCTLSQLQHLICLLFTS